MIAEVYEAWFLFVNLVCVFNRLTLTSLCHFPQDFHDSGGVWSLTFVYNSGLCFPSILTSVCHFSQRFKFGVIVFLTSS